jgi:hypothetical protein
MSIRATAPLKLGDVVPAAFDDHFDRMLGQEYVAHDDISDSPVLVRLVEANATVAAPANLMFQRTAESGELVTVTTANADRLVGCTVAAQKAITAGDFFLLVIEGNVQVKADSSTTTIAIGAFVKPSDASNGKVETSTTAKLETCPAICTTAATSPPLDTLINIRLLRKLV